MSFGGEGREGAAHSTESTWYGKCHMYFSPIQISTTDTSQLGLTLVEYFQAWSQANSCWGIYSQEYHEYDSLLALHWILFLNYDFHHSSKNRGWLWNITSAPVFSKSYTFLILFSFWGFSFNTGALLDQSCDGRGRGGACILWKTLRRRCLSAILIPAGRKRPQSLPQQSEATVKQSYTDSWFAEQGFLATLKGRSKSLVN